MLPLDKVPRRTDVVVPADDPFDGIAHHVDVDRHGQPEAGKVRIADVLDVHGRYGKIGNHFGQFLLAVWRKADHLEPLDHVPVEGVIVPDGQPAEQLHERLAANLGHAVEEDDGHLGAAGVVQVVGAQRLHLELVLKFVRYISVAHFVWISFLFFHFEQLLLYRYLYFSYIYVFLPPFLVFKKISYLAFFL